MIMISFFFPLLLSERPFSLHDLQILLYGFLIFAVMTSICYATNDFTDRKKDLINKLKNKKKF